LAGAAQTTSFVDSGLNMSTQYCYTVAAVNAAGTESAASAPACITTLAPLPDTTIPAVVSTSPANHETNVQTDPLTISVVFSEPMNMLSAINAGNFTLGAVTGVRNYDAATYTLTFTPSTTLASSTTYTATVSGSVTDAAGNSMGVDYVWSFTTTTAPVVTVPSVVSTSPTNSATGVAVTTVITAVFSDTMAPLTITQNTSNFTVSPGVTGLVTYDDATKTATFTPDSLTASTIYTCKISKNVTDLAGHPMAADYTWTFTTQ
jgi:hypothetical protein